MPVTDCRHFSGYKPCSKSSNCDEHCPSMDVPISRLLVIHLEALGAVLRATSILPALRKNFPKSHVTWVTEPSAAPLLQNNPLIDRILTTKRGDLLALSALSFDAAFVIDKSLRAAGVLKQTKADRIFGFVANSRTGAVEPATSDAIELWEVGLSNAKKFFQNKKPETQLITEALGLNYDRDPYVLKLTEEEKTRALVRRSNWIHGKRHLVGINTGSSGVIPYKKLTVAAHRELIQLLQKKIPNAAIVLLGGGTDDAIRNRNIAESLSVSESPTDFGLRDGMSSVAACDIVISGDSLGMHMGIALEKWVVAWFGPTCAHEIDLYGRGRKILADVPCGPCWRRSCHNTVMCYDRVNFDQILKAVNEGLSWAGNRTSSYKLPFSAISSSPSP